MEFSKKNLLYLIENQKLSEMPMDFSDVPNPKYNPNDQEGEPGYGEPEKIPFPHRPDRSVQQKLATGDTPHKKVPFPKTGKENDPVASNKMNFQELLASESYKEVIANVQQYGGLVGNMQNASLTGEMYAAYNSILQIERDYKEELESLAIEIVEKEMKIPHGRFNIDAKLMDMQDISHEGFNREQGPENNEPEVDVDDEDEEQPQPLQGGNQPNPNDEAQLFKALKDLSLEKAKRRLINSIIQGGSKKGHYMYSGDMATGTGEYDDKGNEIYTYQRIPELLTQITGSDQLTRLYGILMSINDTNYWQFSNDMIKRLSGSMVGRNHVIFPNQQEEGGDEDDQEQPDMGGGDDEEGEGGEEDNRVKIVAVGAVFPVLVHEIVKGVYEAFAGHGLPDSEEEYNKIAQTEDVLEKEMWDLRLGPAIFNRLRNQIDVKYLVEEDYKEVQNFLLATIFKLPAKEFLVLMKEVISGSKKGAKLIQDIINGIENKLNGIESDMEDFDDELENLTDETPDDDVLNFINSIPGVKSSGNFGDDVLRNLFNNEDDEDDEDDDDGGEPVLR
jgi:hypothetical protein